MELYAWNGLFKWMYFGVSREPHLCPTEVFVTSCGPLLPGLPVALLACRLTCLTLCLACRFSYLTCLSNYMTLGSASLVYSPHLVEFLVASLNLQYFACLPVCQCAFSLGLLYSLPVFLLLPFRPPLIFLDCYLLAAKFSLIPTRLFIFNLYLICLLACLTPSLGPFTLWLRRPLAGLRFDCA